MSAWRNTFPAPAFAVLRAEPTTRGPPVGWSAPRRICPQEFRRFAGFLCPPGGGGDEALSAVPVKNDSMTRIPIPGEGGLSFFGIRDRNLRSLEHDLGLTLASRGDILLAEGPEDRIALLGTAPRGARDAPPRSWPALPVRGLARGYPHPGPGSGRFASRVLRGNRRHAHAGQDRAASEPSPVGVHPGSPRQGPRPRGRTGRNGQDLARDGGGGGGPPKSTGAAHRAHPAGGGGGREAGLPSRRPHRQGGSVSSSLSTTRSTT